VSWRLVSAHATTSDPRFETQAAIAASIAVHNEVKRAGWSTVEAGAPVALFLTRLFGIQGLNMRQQYMPSPDGQRFLVDTVTESVESPITVILNWKPKE
jgi:hypothetical protein